MERSFLLWFHPLLLVCFLVRPAGAVVQARAPGLQGPRVSSTLVKAPSIRGPIAVVPLQDAPQSPGSGARVDQALRAVLARRALTVRTATAPVDAAGTPVPGGLLSPTALARVAREAGGTMGLSGQVQSLSQEEQYRPNAVVLRQGVYLGVPAEDRTRFEIRVRIQVVAANNGRPLYQGAVRYGPVDTPDPAGAIAAAIETLITRWLGPPPP